MKFAPKGLNSSHQVEPASKPYLRLTNVGKQFGQHQVLRNVSLDVHENEFVCFLGPSGCGKTTLLRVIAGLELQTSGTMEQAGRDISRLPAAERNFGIVFQNYALFPNLTVERNVGYGLWATNKRKSNVKSRVSEMLSLVDISELAGRYPSQLSGGQQQRVAMARALATSPGLLLLDEPLSALDARVRINLRSKLKGLQRQLGVTTIMVTHDQEEAMTMADRIVVMNNGMIEQIGSPADVYNNPATSFVADFIGAMESISGFVSGSRTVRVGNLNLTCARDFSSDTIGDGVTVSIRPEDIGIRNVRPGEENTAVAEIMDVEFVGPFSRITLKVDAGEYFELQAVCSVTAIRELDLIPGKRIQVSFPTDRLRTFSICE